MFTDVDGSWTEVGSVVDTSGWSVISLFTDVGGSWTVAGSVVDTNPSSQCSQTLTLAELRLDQWWTPVRHLCVHSCRR